MKIFTIADKKEEKFLRKKTAEFEFDKFSKKEINDLIKQMRETMNKAAGVGLSANQLGLNLRMFVAQISKEVKSQKSKVKSQFYAVFNPKIKTPLFRNKKTKIEEGCLSVPGIYGEVERPERITLVGQDKNGRKIKIKAFGLLARVFQHEVDHLNGVLFIDKAKILHKFPIKAS
jgi:peptide deformylase